MNKEIQKMYEDLPSWKREENFSPAVRNIIELNTPVDEEKKKILEELHSEIDNNLERLLKSKSVEEKIISQRIILSALKSKGLIDEDQLKENNQWIDIQFLGKGRGIVPRRKMTIIEK